MILRYAMIACLLASLTACSAGKRTEAMQTTLTEYAQLMRWGDVAGAGGFLDPEMPELVPDEHYLARLANYQVTRYRELGRSQIDEDTLSQRIELRLVNIHTQGEHTILHDQTWRYDAEAQRWWKTSPMPQLPGRRR